MLTVNSLSDDTVSGDQMVTLREAIEAANFDGTTDLGQTGAGPDTIRFDPSLFDSGPKTITLSLGELLITNGLDVEGPGASMLTIDASGNDLTPGDKLGDGSRVFRVGDGGNGPAFNASIGGVTLTGGNVDGDGGAIFNQNPGLLSVAAAVIRNNFATAAGGGIASDRGTALVVNSTIELNESLTDGGGIFSSSGTLTVTTSTVSNNQAVRGGGIANDADLLTLFGSTISGNFARDEGGGVRSGGDSTANIRFTTVTNNEVQESFGGGGIRNFGTVNLNHAIVADNYFALDDPSGGLFAFDDISGDVAARYSLIGVDTGATVTDNGENIIGDESMRIDPQLAPLAENGGPTRTHALNAGSPAIDAGDPDLQAGVGGTPAFDQRGTPFARILDGRIDIGAFEGQVEDEVPSLIVTTEIDVVANDGLTSLREAIDFANSSEGDDTITFDPGVFSTTQVINLVLGELVISDAVTIIGPAANLLTIDAQQQSRIFHIMATGEPPAIDVSLAGMTLTGGNIDDLDDDGGGAIRHAIPGMLTLTEMAITGNTVDGAGGGIASVSGGLLRVVGSTIDTNQASETGGGIHVRSGSLVLLNSTISGNSATGNGGGIDAAYGAAVVSIAHSTITDNRSTSTVGGIRVQSLSFEATNSIIAANLGSLATSDLFSPDLSIGSSVNSVAYSLIGDASNSGASLGDGTIAGESGSPIDPQLDPLFDNGGPTRTHALRPFSLAVNMGNAAVQPEGGELPATDQRGADRIVGGQVDMGAFEGQVEPSSDPELSLPGPQSLLEGGELVLENLVTFTDLDVEDFHTATVNWGDGSPTVDIDVENFGGGGTLIGNHVYADNGEYQVTVMLFDSQQGFDQGEFTVVVDNVNPSASLANNGPIAEGLPGEVSFSNPFDPGSVDTSTGFRYAYDFDNDGTFEIGDGTYEGSVSDASRMVPGSFLDDGPATYTVRARIIDKDGGFMDYTTDVSVFNIQPILANITGDVIDENTEATVSATIADSSSGDVFEVDVDWRDGTSDTVSGLGSTDASGTVGGTRFVWTAASRQLQLSHRYLDDDPTGTLSDDFLVELTVRDDDGGSSGPFMAVVSVDNVNPILTVPETQVIAEGQLLDLSGGAALQLGQFIDEGVSDIHTATVNWGDGSETEAAGLFFDAGSGVISGSHTYADNGVYTVTVTIADDDGGNDVEMFTVTVANVLPTLNAPFDGQMVTVNEGTELALIDIGTLTDPGFRNDDLQTDETFTYSINWGDGTSSLVGNASIDNLGGAGEATAGSFDGLHTYANDGIYTVTIRLADDDMSGDFVNGTVDEDYVERTFEVTVENVTPNVVNLSATNSTEGGATTLSGNIVDPGILDTFTLTIDWGDASAMQTVDFAAGTTSFSVMHTYADDDPSGTSSDPYTISVMLVNDGSSEAAMGDTTITVSNAVPIVSAADDRVATTGRTLDLSGENGAPALATFTDAGVLDTHTATVNWGDGVVEDTVVVEGSGFNSVGGTHTYTSAGVFTVMVTVTDDDGGSQTRPFQVTVFEPSIVVDTLVDESDGDFSPGDLSLREAIERANLVTGPARITFAPALSGGRIQLVLGELIVTNSVDVDATDLPGGIIVDASGNDPTPASTRDDGDDTNDGDGSRVFNIDDGVPAHLLEVAIWGMTLTGGDVMGSGGAIRSVENLTIRSSTISGNQATDGGGGIAHSIGELTVAYSTIAANSASFGGGVANEGGMLTIDSSTISGNAASFGGVQGGGLIVGDDVVFVIDISGSTGSLFGGDAVGDLNNDGRANTILDAEIAAFLAVNQRLVDLGLGNLSKVGIVAFDTARFIQDMDRDLDGPQSFTTPLADSDGNGIRDVEDVLRSLQIGGGTDFEVGLAGAIEVINDAGIAPGNGNVIFLSDGVGSGNFFDEIETIRESLNLNLRAFGVGPGASLEQLQQIDPQAIRFSNTNELLGVFSGQNAGTGGGIWTSVAESRSTRISHSTITNNTADANSSGNGSGGGIFVAGSGSLVLDHSIVAANIDNSTIAPDVDAVSAGSNVTVTAEFSLIGRNTGSGLAATPIGRSDAFGNLIGTAAAPIDPLLGPLMNNGGRTPTHSLLPGSPALNAGDPDFMPPPDFDQRGAGFPRIRNGRIDIGALEGQVIVDTRQRQITPVVTPVPPVIETEPPTSDVRPTAIVQAVILPISDAGSGGGVPNQKRESPPLDRLAAAEIALRRALSRPQSVRRADVIDVVFSLGEVELASVLGIDMGDEPVYHHQTRKEEAEDEAGEPVAEVAELPPTIDPAPAEPVTPPVVESDGPPLTLWGAIAGSGMLWLGGTWWWLGRKRKRRLLG